MVAQVEVASLPLVEQHVVEVLCEVEEPLKGHQKLDPGDRASAALEDPEAVWRTYVERIPLDYNFDHC